MKIEITLDDKNLNFLENLANELNSNIQNIVKNALNEYIEKQRQKKSTL